MGLEDNIKIGVHWIVREARDKVGLKQMKYSECFLRPKHVSWLHRWSLGECRGSKNHEDKRLGYG